MMPSLPRYRLRIRQDVLERSSKATMMKAQSRSDEGKESSRALMIPDRGRRALWIQVYLGFKIVRLRKRDTTFRMSPAKVVLASSWR